MSRKAMMGAAAVLMTVLASPAFAATSNARAAQVAHHNRGAVHGTAGQYIGSDPDPFIRDQLARDPSQGGAAMER